MSFFSFLGKAVGKVAKAGLGVVTGGVSTQIIDTVGGLLNKKKSAVNQQNLYQAAGITDDYSPPAKLTRTIQPGGGAQYLPAYRTADPRDAVIRSAPRRRKRTARRAAPPPRTRGKRRSSGARRAPPPGGLDLKAMSAAWRNAGSPGTWREWIQTNPIRR